MDSTISALDLAADKMIADHVSGVQSTLTTMQIEFEPFTSASELLGRREDWELRPDYELGQTPLARADLDATGLADLFESGDTLDCYVNGSADILWCALARAAGRWIAANPG